MKLGNYRFLIVTRELITRGIRANLKMYQKKAKLKSQVELAETITGHRDKCLPVQKKNQKNNFSQETIENFNNVAANLTSRFSVYLRIWGGSRFLEEGARWHPPPENFETSSPRKRSFWYSGHDGPQMFNTICFHYFSQWYTIHII